MGWPVCKASSLLLPLTAPEVVVQTEPLSVLAGGTPVGCASSKYLKSLICKGRALQQYRHVWRSMALAAES